MSKSQEYSFESPDAAMSAEVVASLRVVGQSQGKAKRATKAVREDQTVQEHIGKVCQRAARYALGILSKHSALSGKALDTLQKEIRAAFNAPLIVAFGKSYSLVKSTVSVIHSVVMSPATMPVFGIGWQDGKYGTEIAPVTGDKPAHLTFWEGRKRLSASKRPNTPQAIAEKWLRASAKRATDSRNFYSMVSALVESLLAEGSPKPEVAKAPKAPRKRSQPAKVQQETPQPVAA